MRFPCTKRLMYRSHGLYKFYLLMESLALVAYLTLGAVSLFLSSGCYVVDYTWVRRLSNTSNNAMKVYALKFLTKGSPCANLSQKGCLAIVATDAFTGIAGVMQIAQIIALMFLFHTRPRKPEKVKKPKKSNMPKQPKRPKQRYQQPAENTYMDNSYPNLQPPPPAYTRAEKSSDWRMEEARATERLDREEWKREVKRLRAQSKARYDTERRAAERIQDVREFYERRNKREEEIERLKRHAQAREKRIQKLKDDLEAQEEALEDEEDAREREDEISRLQARIMEQDEKLRRIKKRQSQVGRGRRDAITSTCLREAAVQ